MNYTEENEDQGVELVMADPRMGEATLSHIKSTLDRIFGKSEWASLEIETISMVLGLILDGLTRDKIQLLQIFEVHPDKFFDDPVFMLYATDVINNIEADFEYVPTPTSLELAYAIEEVKKILAANDQYFSFDYNIVESVAYLLRQEGYSEPIETFDFIPKDKLVAGQTPEDTENKRKAIKKYLKHMGI
jgi:hypothetical protein